MQNNYNVWGQRTMNIPLGETWGIQQYNERYIFQWEQTDNAVKDKGFSTGHLFIYPSVYLC